MGKLCRVCRMSRMCQGLLYVRAVSGVSYEQDVSESVVCASCVVVCCISKLCQGLVYEQAVLGSVGMRERWVKVCRMRELGQGLLYGQSVLECSVWAIRTRVLCISNPY